MFTKIPRRPLIAAAGAAILLATLSAQAQTALDEVMARKLIRIAIPTDFPPYGSVVRNIKPKGLYVEMAELIAAKLGVKV